MIHELTGRRGLFYPRRLVNALVRWVLGVHSPTGTIKVSNTANPADKSVALDVDVDAVLARARSMLDARGLSDRQIEDVVAVLRCKLDGRSIEFRNGLVKIGDDWLATFVDERIRAAITESEEDDPGTAPDTELPAPTDGDKGFIGDNGTDPSAGDDVRWPTLNGVITDLRNGTTWSAGGGTGVVVPVVDEIIRVGLNDFYLMRKLTYDSAGHLRHVSGEFCAFKNLAYISSNS